MSIKNFKNPWDVGGPLHPDWLGGEKALGGDVLPEKNNEQRQNKEVIPFRLFLYGVQSMKTNSFFAP